jgi:hypothetical protein
VASWLARSEVAARVRQIRSCAILGWSRLLELRSGIYHFESPTPAKSSQLNLARHAALFGAGLKVRHSRVRGNNRTHRPHFLDSRLQSLLIVSLHALRLVEE